jgi:hypothetical protein
LLSRPLIEDLLRMIASGTPSQGPLRAMAANERRQARWVLASDHHQH